MMSTATTNIEQATNRWCDEIERVSQDIYHAAQDLRDNGVIDCALTSQEYVDELLVVVCFVIAVAHAVIVQPFAPLSCKGFSST